MDTDAITGCICVSIKIRHPNEFCTGFQIEKCSPIDFDGRFNFLRVGVKKTLFPYTRDGFANSTSTYLGCDFLNLRFTAAR